jgi:hypothetical protein
LLSRFPIQEDQVIDLHETLWRDATGHSDLTELIPADAVSIQRLASVSAAAIPLNIEGKTLWILTHHATPPIFDGPEDRNGFRNADENGLWLRFLDGDFGVVPIGPFVLAAVLNVDPTRGEGHQDRLVRLLTDLRWTDPFAQLPVKDAFTASFQNAGKLRLSYILPASKLHINDFGMSADLPPNDESKHSRHRLLWVDVEIPK